MIGTDCYHLTLDLLPLAKHAEAHVLQPPAPAPHDYRVSELTVSGHDSVDNMSSSGGATSHEPLKAQLLGRGAIRLFRDFQTGPVEAHEHTTAVDTGDDTMLSIIALPTYFTATDLLGFVGTHYMEHITHVRVLKSEKPNRFLVLLKFNDPLAAAEFQYHFDGKPFNSMEPEACHVVFVRSVTIAAPASSETPAPDALIPFLMKDPFTLGHSFGVTGPGPNSGSTDGTLVSVELPTCPVCLEKLDCEISGLLTIPCQHTFHCQCLSKWRDDTCPVCRYTNSVSNQKIQRSVRRLLQINSRMQQTSGDAPPVEAGDDVDTCMDCATADGLWVCLVCGNLGCSRYAPEQHLLKHFVETGHCFAMELATSRVWDYAGDSYVHRLIMSESDGKIVEFPNKLRPDEKLGKLATESDEYSELLLSQLISQREYYELLLKEKGLAGAARRRSSAIEPAAHMPKVTELEERLEELTAKLDKVTTHVIPALKRKIDIKQVSLKVAAEGLQEANALGEGLSQKVEFLTAQNAELKAQNEDLAEQVKDLMFYLESREKFKDQPPEITDGQVVMRPKKSNRKKKK